MFPEGSASEKQQGKGTNFWWPAFHRCVHNVHTSERTELFAVRTQDAMVYACLQSKSDHRLSELPTDCEYFLDFVGSSRVFFVFFEGASGARVWKSENR